MTRVFVAIAALGMLLCAGCSAASRTQIIPSSSGANSAHGSQRSPHYIVIVAKCIDPECSNCDPEFQYCQYCDPSLLDCPGEVSITGGGGGGGGAPPSAVPICSQVIDGPAGTFDNVRTHVSYSVPSYAQTQYIMLSQSHVDQVDVDFYIGTTFLGTAAAGGTSSAQAGSYYGSPPITNPFDSTRMTGSWVDKDPSHTTPATNLTFTATANTAELTGEEDAIEIRYYYRSCPSDRRIVSCRPGSAAHAVFSAERSIRGLSAAH